jgi:hypothetical protein
MVQKVNTPRWVALAVAEHLKSVWHEGMGQDEAWTSAAEAFKTALGWGQGGKTGLKKMPGFKAAKSCWDTCVGPFELQVAVKRTLLRHNHVLPYCKREGIVLNVDETLLQYFERIGSWGAETLIVCPLRDVSCCLDQTSELWYCSSCHLRQRKMYCMHECWNLRKLLTNSPPSLRT